ncbi:MAG: transglutaminase-like domain-containing protein, partial [Armatimonadia bacterium]
QPMAVNVLKHGGSCCVSAMTAVTILRACGIPAQITYTSFSSYIHGITQFYLNGYGWLRIETTCSHAKVPLTEREQDLGLVRIYDLTLEGEAASMWAWPYMHFGEKGEYPYRSGGQECKALKVGRYVPGILSTGAEVLGGVPNAGGWAAWDDLVRLSREAVRAKTVGEFGTLTGLLPETKPYAVLMPAKVPAPKGGGD